MATMNVETPHPAELVWETRNLPDDKSDDVSWEISAKCGSGRIRIILYEQYRADAEGVCISDLSNNAKEFPLKRTDLAHLWRQVIQCMDKIGRKNAYIEPAHRGIQRMVDSLRAEFHQEESNLYVLSREQLEQYCDKLEGKS